MLIKSQKVKCIGKEILKGVSKTGKDYETKNVYYQDNDGLSITTSFNNDIVYSKATKDKMYSLIIYLSPNGRLQINNIEE